MKIKSTLKSKKSALKKENQAQSFALSRTAATKTADTPSRLAGITSTMLLEYPCAELCSPLCPITFQAIAKAPMLGKMAQPLS
jgi:hypothetical protein